MSVHKRTAAVVVARQMRNYKTGDQVRILRGKLAGQILTVRDSANDWVMLNEALNREVMSKGNVEPIDGFTEDELMHAKRAADKMQGLGSLI
jgi:hypothetical protein